MIQIMVKSMGLAYHGGRWRYCPEVEVKCYNCSEMVYRERTPSCIDWCAAARQCLGDARWRQLKGGD